MRVTCPNPKCQCSFDVPSRDVIKAANRLKGKRNNKPVGEVPDDIGNRIELPPRPPLRVIRGGKVYPLPNTISK